MLALAGAASTQVGPVDAAGQVSGDPGDEPVQEAPHIDFTDDPTSEDVRQVTDRIDAIDAEARIRASLIDGPAGDIDFSSAGGDYTIEYMTSVPAGHAAVFTDVMEEWANAVDFNSGGIHVQVHYQSLGSGALAGASHYSVLEGPSGARYAIPTALRNANEGGDQFPTTPDIIVYVNADQNWSTSLSGSIPSSQYSLWATLLHEIGHGLGVSSDLDPSSSPGDFFSALDERVYRDTATSTSTGPTSPVSSTTSPAVQTGKQWFLNLDGTWERIYDPTGSYQSGSSMSHLDENTYSGFSGAAGALMTPTLFNGETVSGVDGIVLGLMEGIGWTVETAPIAPSVTDSSVVPGSVEVTVSPSTSTAGPPAVEWIVTISNDAGVVSSSTHAATERSLVIPVHLVAGDYTLGVAASGSGGSSSPTQRGLTSLNSGAAPTYDNCRQAPVNPAFGTSDETNASVYRLYCSYFLRYPDQDGFGYWLSEFDSGARDLNDISEFFAISTEFTSTYGSLTNSQFVGLIYTNILEREPEATGFDFWLGELDSGNRTRGWLMLFFSQSDEFRTKTGTLN